MKTDLASSIGLAVVGVIVSYLICNILVGTWTTDSYDVKTIETIVSSDVAEPDANIFNYRSLNPTVEVYVGNCKEFDADGQCIDNDSEEINQDIIDESTNRGSESDSDSPTDNTPTRREE